MTAENKTMKWWLEKNGIKCMPKYIKDGSMRGTWRFYGDGKWWGNKELQDKFTKLGFVSFDGDTIDDYDGNGGEFSVFLILTDKYAEGFIRFGTDDKSAIY